MNIGYSNDSRLFYNVYNVYADEVLILLFVMETEAVEHICCSQKVVHLLIVCSSLRLRW